MARMWSELGSGTSRRGGRLALFAVLLLSVAVATPAMLRAEEGPAEAETPAAFDPTGWTTVDDYTPLGDPRAVRVPAEGATAEDFTFRIPWGAFPTTLRTHGPNANSVQTRGVQGLVYESMVQIHPDTEEFIPCLASHWKIETHEDGLQTFTFRIDERAKWADGQPVTANDVYYSWWHRTREDRKDPSTRMTFIEGFEEPVVLDTQTIQVKTKKVNWRLFLYFGGQAIYPAAEMNIPGEQYLKDYDWKMPVGSGPYVVNYDLLKKGESMVLERRDDWWAENEKWAKNTYNFDRIKYVVVRDREMVYNMFKKGDFDYYLVGQARRWVEDIPKEDDVVNGWIQKRKIYNQQPVGYSGLCFNMRKPPFDDIKVRMAFAHLFNREMLMEKLFYNEYDYTKSIFPGRDWGSGADRERLEYDPDYAEELLDEAGYSERDDKGFLINEDGERLEVTLQYGTQAWERIWLPVKEYFEEAGIQFNLKLLDPSTLMKKISERQFTIHFQSWGALLFPNPETSWRSSLADQPYNNNIPGFKNEEVDRLCQEYNRVLDRPGQKAITRKIDDLVCEQYPYAFAWHSNFFRVLFWDRFGHPEDYVSRIGDQIDEQMLLYWWFDVDRQKAMEAAKSAKPPKPMPQRAETVRPWAE